MIRNTQIKYYEVVILPYHSYNKYIFLSSTLYGQGLEFKGNDYPIDERTSYNVFNDTPIQFSDKFNISFEMSLTRPSRLGYIVRIKNENNKIYNLSYYNDGIFSVFKLNEEGKNSLIAAKFETKDLVASRWFQVSIKFDLQKILYVLQSNNKNFLYTTLSYLLNGLQTYILERVII